MPETEEDLKQCAACGAVIYPEQVQKHTADWFAGKLMCGHCLAEKRSPANTGGATTGLGTHQAGSPAESVGRPAPGIALADEPVMTSAAVRHTATLQQAEAAVHKKSHALKRPLVPGTQQATRCKTFHCKMSEGAVAYLNDQINEWVDGHEDVTIKFATSSVGVFEGKHSEQHLVVTVFY